MEKIRVGGVTVSADKSYSGKEVINLLKISFENGNRRGLLEADKQYQRGFSDGYSKGYTEASSDFSELRNILQKILNSNN